MGKPFGMCCDGFRKGTTFVLLRVPLIETDLVQKLIHDLRLAGEVTFVQMPGVPLQQHAAEVEDDGFDGSAHAGDSIRLSAV